eukprot:CAMPEP_0179110822 /NCGR_PEP_ID=MMETSP0796-20121207/51738_1 /TAXON_ID=73915 /ORGANISM="Pyrodinium bahamense, Strain pbaha01" /LENGTH=311 /DNA_ID=CAMNT_0020808965 /DNA_START=23 /DNA_END=959 /DNA_ORIENTATION=-
MNQGGRLSEGAGIRLSEGARDLLLGMAAGFTTKVLEYPFDTVKVLLQTMGSRYAGPLDCLTTAYRRGGLAALYRGLPTPLLGSMVECSTQFVAYGAMKNALDVDEEHATLANPVPMWKYSVAGAWSGCCSSFIMTPVELIKCRMQVLSGASPFGSFPAAQYSGAWECFRQILRERGAGGFWRGIPGCLARDIPGNVAWFGTYELAMRRIQVALGLERKADVPLAYSAIAGSAAGMAYWAVPFPADTVKSKMQADPRLVGMPLAGNLPAGGSGGGRCGAVPRVRDHMRPSDAVPPMLFIAYEAASSWLKRFS